MIKEILLFQLHFFPIAGGKVTQDTNFIGMGT